MLCGIPIITADGSAELVIVSIVCSGKSNLAWTRVRCNLWHLLPTFLSYAKQKTEATNILLLLLQHKSARLAHIIAASKLLFICLKMKQLLASQHWHATGSSPALLCAALLCSHRRCDADVKLRMCGASFVSLAFLPLSGQKAQQPQLLNMPHSDTHTHAHRLSKICNYVRSKWSQRLWLCL